MRKWNMHQFRGKNNRHSQTNTSKVDFLKRKNDEFVQVPFLTRGVVQFELPQSLQAIIGYHLVLCYPNLDLISTPGKRCVFALCWHVLESE